MSARRRATLGTVLLLAAAGPTAVAAVLASAGLLAPGGRRGIELVAFTPAGLPAALLGVVGAVALTSRQRRTGRVVLVLALACAALHAWWLAPRFTGEVPAAAAGAPRLVVMVQNVEGVSTAELVALTEQHRVDVLVLADTTDQLVAELASTSVWRDLPHTTLADGRGSVVWSRHPIASSARISELGESRMVSLAVPGLGEVRVIAVHPTPPYVADGVRWQEDWEQVLDRVEQVQRDPATGSVVVMGDLNATPAHWPLRALARRGFRDTAEQLNAGMTATWPANGRERRLGVAVPMLLSLDHVLTSPGMVATDQVVTDAAGGDHRGVIATLAPAAP